MTQSLRQAVIECLRENGVTRENWKYKEYEMTFAGELWTVTTGWGAKSETVQVQRIHRFCEDFDELMKEVEE